MHLIKNCRVFTAAEGDTGLHDALVVDCDKVVYVGDAASAAKQAGESPQTTDLNGAVVLPGILDGHTHLIHFGSTLTRVNCYGLTIPEIQRALKSAREANPGADMILGCSFIYDSLGAPPNRSFLDDVVGDIPVIVDCIDLHASWVNSAALTALGVGKETPNPAGGEFERDEHGELTGLFKETALTEVIWPWVARRMSMEDRIELLDRVFDAYLATGVTGCVEMALTPDDLSALEAYHAQKGLPIRVAAHWFMRPGGTSEETAAQVRQAAHHRERLRGIGTAPWLEVVGIKFISDGVIDSCTAYMKDPFPRGGHPGPIWAAEELNKAVTLADSLGLQVAIHAIGDAASSQALDAFEAALAANGPNPTRRHRMEHLEVISAEDVLRTARLGITASMQPAHADPTLTSNWRHQLNNDHRCDRGWPWTEFIAAKANVAFGSDAPTAPHYAFTNMYTATTRRSGMVPDYPPPTEPRWLAFEKLSVKLDQAIRFYTLGTAYSLKQEHQYGSLEPGKAADFCVLNIDPFSDGLDTLREAQNAVTQTWIGGKQVWKASG